MTVTTRAQAPVTIPPPRVTGRADVGLRVSHGEAAALDVDVPGQAARLAGRLDVLGVSAVRQALHRLVDDGDGDLLLDVSRTSVRDATGLGLLVGVHHRARLQGRRLVLVDVPERLESLIRHTRLHRVLARTASTP